MDGDPAKLESALEALRQSEARLRRLYDSGMIGICSFDLDGAITDANDKFLSIVGYERQDLEAGRISWEQMTPPEYRDADLRAIEELHATGVETPYEKEYVRKDGSRVPVLIGAALFDDARRHGMAFVLDATDRRRAETALRRSEEDARAQAAQLEAILEAVADGLVVYDREGRTLRSTPAADALLGIPAGERSGPVRERASLQYEVLDESGRRPAAEEMIAYRAAVKGEIVRGAVLRIRPASGPPRWIRASAVPFVLDGRHAGAVLSMTDITGRKQAEEALRESEQRLRAIFEDAAVGIMEMDAEDRFLAVNTRFCEMLGYAPRDLLGRTVHDVTAPEDRAITRELNARAHAGELGLFDYQKRYLRRDGSPMWVHVTVSIVRDEEGRFVRSIGTAEDITERKRAEEGLREANERLREADRRKDDFLGMLSHELRNPLAPIRNALYILDHADPAGPQARRAREIAGRQVAHMTRLVDDLLDVTRIARGKIELRRARLDLAALARRAAEDQRGLMQARHLDLAVEVPDGPVLVDGDETRLAQVLGNLLHNAAKFTPAGGRVTLAVAAHGGRAIVNVRDTGAGIEPAMLRAVFEPFTQVEQTLARSEGGLGLGLALVKGLVALHGGEVAAYSAGRGRGTDFVVSLPLAGAPGARPRGRNGRGALRAGQPRRVLVIDDNRDSADSLAQLVSMIGHHVEVAYDAFEGLSRAAEDLPDVILCDIGLPGMDGYEFARQLRTLSADRDVRLVAVSGYALPEDVSRAVEAGFDAHVAKPPDPERIAALLG